jgi:ribosomal protein L11 methyltransferase
MRMLEGLPPHRPTHVMRLVTDETTARHVADFIMESFDPAETAAAAFENEKTLRWEVEVYFSDPPDEAGVAELVALAAGPEAAGAITFESIGEKDWVRSALEGLSIVRAGRFAVHGSHDRAGIPVNAIAIEIEAALAFGTGHHGTTRGCLLMLDKVLKRRTPQRVLDVGTGSGVLAIAAARVLHRPVASGDIDPVAVEAARQNARHNRAGFTVRPVVARGTGHPVLAAGAPYDLVFANILARPLMRLAPSIAAVAAPRAEVILSGLIPRDVPGVLAAYRAQGLHLVEQMELEGWATLLVRAGGGAARKL